MKKIFIVAAILICNHLAFAQNNLKEYKAGHVFYLSLPEYMTKTTGLNSAATIQFKSTVKDVYGFVIEDSKEDLKIIEMFFPNVKDFYDDFIKDFLKDEKKRNVGEPIATKKGSINFVENDISYYSKESKTEIYYFVGLAESETTFYKVLCYCTLENKEKMKSDFQQILYSLKD